MSFEHAVMHVIEREGGYVNHPDDPGGETKFGISKQAYPDLDIANLTIQQAHEIYRRDYWDRIRGDELDGKNDSVAFVLFDAAVNMGVTRAVVLLQKALGVPTDGVFGSGTMAAIKDATPASLIERFLAERVLFYSNLPTFRTFGKGWVRRVIGVAMEAAK